MIPVAIAQSQHITMIAVAIAPERTTQERNSATTIHRPPLWSHNHHVWEHVIASGFASTLTYPLWRATAMAQSGFVVQPTILSTTIVGRVLAPYVVAASPPYKGLFSASAIMTVGRFAIFWGSDALSARMRANKYPSAVCGIVPPALISTMVVTARIRPVNGGRSPKLWDIFIKCMAYQGCGGVRLLAFSRRCPNLRRPLS